MKEYINEIDDESDISSISLNDNFINDDIVDDNDNCLEFLCPVVSSNVCNDFDINSNLFLQLIKFSEVILSNDIDNNILMDINKPLYTGCSFTLQEYLMTLLFKKKLKNYGDEDIFLDCNTAASFLPPNNLLSKLLEEYNNTRSFIRFVGKTCSIYCKPLSTFKIGKIFM